jgi:hypothetical protein
MCFFLPILKHQNLKVCWLIWFLAAVFIQPGAMAGPSIAYQVELLIFRSVKAESHTESGSRRAILEQVRLKSNQGFKIVEKAGFQTKFSGRLEPVRRRLAASQHHQVLFHGYWNNSPDTGNDKLARLDLTAVDGRRILSGTFRLHSGQLLFLEAAIVLHGQPAAFLSDVSEKPHLLEETRRIRLEEIHYLDHPEFGLMLIVRHHPLPQ